VPVAAGLRHRANLPWSGVPAATSFGSLMNLALVFSPFSGSLFKSASESFALNSFVKTRRWSHLIDLLP
jgi:hypothetical protein